MISPRFSFPTKIYRHAIDHMSDQLITYQTDTPIDRKYIAVIYITASTIPIMLPVCTRTMAAARYQRIVVFLVRNFAWCMPMSIGKKRSAYQAR